MKKYLYGILVVTLILVPRYSIAQSGNILTQTRTWHSAKGINLTTGDTLTREMNFKSYSADKIMYVGPRGPVQEFNITGTTGTWTNISQDGMMTYHVLLGDQAGTIIISRSGPTVSLVVNMTAAATGGVNMKYLIHTID